MTRGLIALLVSQFLTAFCDNAILFTVIAIVLQNDQSVGWYVPAMQSVFLLSFVFLAPWVGPFADKQSKPRVLIIGNLLKTAGALLILLNVEPLIAYALVGLGAAVYSPAKYGILPEMVDQASLVRANSWIEASTIAAIILGTLAGGKLADQSIQTALLMVVLLYLVSMAVTLLIPTLAPCGAQLKQALPEFGHMIRQFMHSPRARFAMLGASLFWAAAAVLRVVLVAWAPLVLATRSAGDISELTLFLAIGVITGSALVPKLIPLQHLRRARLAAFAMGIFIVLFGLVDSVWLARLSLLLIGVAGGTFIVPLNAALQAIGHATIGSGRAVAIQNFFQNLAMLLAVGLYTAASAAEVTPITTLYILGLLVLAITWLLTRRLSEEAS